MNVPFKRLIAWIPVANERWSHVVNGEKVSSLMSTLKTFTEHKHWTLPINLIIAWISYFSSSVCNHCLRSTPPTYEMICLGVCVNTLSMTSSVLEFRLQDLLSSQLHRTHFSKWELQQLLRKLPFITKVFPPSHASCCHLIHAVCLCFAQPKNRLHPVSETIRGELAW